MKQIVVLDNEKRFSGPVNIKRFVRRGRDIVGQKSDYNIRYGQIYDKMIQLNHFVGIEPTQKTELM